MNRRAYLAVLCAALLTTGAVRAESPELRGDDNMRSVLEQQEGKRITVRTESGQDLTGRVLAVTDELVHLSELAGQEYYDALISIEAIEAVILRVK